MNYPIGTYYCMTCEGLHTGACFASIKPKREGYAWSTPGESGYRFAIYHRADVEAAANGEPIDETSAIELTGWTAFQRGPGRAFGGNATVKVTKRHVMVKQFTGLDI